MAHIHQPVRNLPFSATMDPIFNAALRGRTKDLTRQVRLDAPRPFAGGGQADIWHGTWQTRTIHQNGQRSTRATRVAVKVFRLIGASDNPEKLAELKRALVREIAVWSPLDHANVAPLFGLCNPVSLGRRISPELPTFVYPFYEKGNVRQYTSTQNMGVQGRLILVIQVTQGLAYLHSQRVVHGDLKGPNILIDKYGKAVLTDFGLSRVLGESGFTTKNVGGTTRWMARELLTVEDETTVARPTAASDVWALGMTAIEIFTDRQPFDHIRADAQVILAISSGQLPANRQYDYVPAVVWRILERCWIFEPAVRARVGEVLAYLERIYTSQAVGRRHSARHR